MEARLDGFVEDYKKGRHSKARTIGLIAQALPLLDEDQPGSTDTALETYIAILSAHEKTLDEPSTGGTGDSNRPDGNEPEQSGTGPGPADPAGGTGPHARRTADDFDDDDAPNLAQSLGGSNKRQRVYEADQPWYIQDVIVQSILPTELQKTRTILLQFAADYSAIKRWIDVSPSVPQFPDSEWDNVIKGRSVNLDTVFSSMYSTEPNVENVEEIGSISIKFGSLKAAKTIKTHGDWVIAWGGATEAITFCFPHRDRELRSYGNIITRLFAAITPNAHSRIINYDRAVRARVGQRNDVLLTDTHKFDDLKLAWIDSIGTGVSYEESTPTRSPKRLQSRDKSADICNNFNKGECKYTAGRCRYTHVCKGCGKPGHGQTKCSAK
jgi:hypothetical protein